MRFHWAINERLEGDDSKLVVYGLGNYTQIQVFVITENSIVRQFEISTQIRRRRWLISAQSWSAATTLGSNE